MSTDSLFRFAFWLIFGAMIAMQLGFASRLRVAGRRVTAGREASGREGRGCAAIRGIRSISFAAFLVCYALNPPWLGLLFVPLAGWLRWLGVALGVASLALYARSRVALGLEWASPLQTRQEHHLVTTGPYARIRHPIYLSMIGFLAGLALVAGNWFLVAFLLVSAVDLALRIPKEEQMMVEEFGHAYKAYMHRTGRLFPKLGAG
jgi:protein-S-isoprenylcysteine O-methyltransferase Ste14